MTEKQIKFQIYNLKLFSFQVFNHRICISCLDFHLNQNRLWELILFTLIWSISHILLFNKCILLYGKNTKMTFFNRIFIIIASHNIFVVQDIIRWLIFLFFFSSVNYWIDKKSNIYLIVAILVCIWKYSSCSKTMYVVAHFLQGPVQYIENGKWKFKFC